MSRLTIYLGKLIGVFLLVISLAMALDKASLVEIVTARSMTVRCCLSSA
jgi:hypothetical protein